MRGSLGLGEVFRVSEGITFDRKTKGLTGLPMSATWPRFNVYFIHITWTQPLSALVTMNRTLRCALGDIKLSVRCPELSK